MVDVKRCAVRASVPPQRLRFQWKGAHFSLFLVHAAAAGLASLLLGAWHAGSHDPVLLFLLEASLAARRLAFALPEASLVNLAVYNMLGQLSLRLPEQHFSAGRHEIRLDKQLGGSGVYLLRLEAQSESGAKFVATRRTLMLH